MPRRHTQTSLSASPADAGVLLLERFLPASSRNVRAGPSGSAKAVNFMYANSAALRNCGYFPSAGSQRLEQASPASPADAGVTFHLRMHPVSEQFISQMYALSALKLTFRVDSRKCTRSRRHCVSPTHASVTSSTLPGEQRFADFPATILHCERCHRRYFAL